MVIWTGHGRDFVGSVSLWPLPCVPISAFFHGWVRPFLSGTSFLVCPLRGWVRPFLSGTSFLVCPLRGWVRPFLSGTSFLVCPPPWLGQAFPFRDKLLSLSPPWLQRSLWFGSQSVTSRISGIVIFFVSSKILYYFNQ